MFSVVLVFVGSHLVAPNARAEEALREHLSPHYLLRTDETEAFAKDALAALEAAWPQLQSFFGAAPELDEGERLSIVHVRSAERWREAMLDDGVQPPAHAGGYYAPANRTAYLFRQPTVYNTRQLLLHEAMHQFHFLACCRNVAPKDVWYVEGLVEHLSRHTWDGKTLRLGVVPTISLADVPEQALASISAPEFDLEAMIDGSKPSTRAEQWALVRFLATSGKVTPRRWARLRTQLDDGQRAEKALPTAIGRTTKWLPELRAWLATQQEPLDWLWNEWQGLGPHAVEGWSTVTCAARVRAPCSELSARIEPEGATKAGLLLHYVDGNDYTVALLREGRTWTVNRRQDGAWRVLAAGSLPESVPLPFAAKAVREGDGVVWSVEGVVLARVALPAGSLGLALEGGRARFHDLAWQ